jgi:hypothetical protein
VETGLALRRQDSNLCIRIRAVDPTSFHIEIRKFESCPRLRVSVNKLTDAQAQQALDAHVLCHRNSVGFRLWLSASVPSCLEKGFRVHALQTRFGPPDASMLRLLSYSRRTVRW